MQNEPSWLPLAEVIAINKSAVAATAERHFLRDMGLLESALSRPEQRFHYGQEDDIVVLAAELFDSIAQNHPFEQGNKRTAWTAAVLFLEINGHEVQPVGDGDLLGEFLTRIVAKKTPIERLHYVLWLMIR